MGGQGCRCGDRTIRGVFIWGWHDGMMMQHVTRSADGDVKQNCPSLRHAHQTKLHLGKTLVEDSKKGRERRTNKCRWTFPAMKISSFSL